MTAAALFAREAAPSSGSMRRSNVITRCVAQQGCVATITSLLVVSGTSILIASSSVMSRVLAWAECNTHTGGVNAKTVVWSIHLRLTLLTWLTWRTRSPSLYARMRQPSTLPSRWNGCRASVGAAQISVQRPHTLFQY